MYVYIDLIFALNLLLDAALLQTTAWVRKLDYLKWRLWLGALIGAVYVLMMFVPALSLAFIFIVKGGFSILMVYTAFGCKSFSYLLRNLAVFYFVNFSVAGGIFGLNYFLQSRHEVLNGMLFTQSGALTFQFQIAAILIVVSGFALLYFVRIIFSAHQRKVNTSHVLAKVEVQIGEHWHRCDGLIDTGNQLYDPLSRLPVMVMEISQWERILPDKWKRACDSREMDEIFQCLQEEEGPWKERLRIIPYKGIQQGSQWMLAIKPDKVVIQQQDIRKENVRLLIGLKSGRLSSDGAYQAIIHPALC